MLVPLHGIASRHDLPLPFSFVVVGAALALAISFVVLAVAWREPRYHRGQRPAAAHPDQGGRPARRTPRRPAGHPRHLGLGGAGPDGRAGPADQPGLRLRLRLGLGGLGTHLAAVRPVLAGDEPAAHHPCRALRPGPGRPEARTGHPPPPARGVAGGRGPVRVRLAGAGPARPDHAAGAPGLGPGLAGDHGARGHRLRPALDRGRRSVRDLRHHGRQRLRLAKGRRRAPARSTRWPT